MPLLTVIQVLSRNGVASVGLVKEWLVEKINDEREENTPKTFWGVLFSLVIIPIYFIYAM